MSQGQVVGQVGYQPLQSGAGSDFRFSRGTELVVADGLPRYYEMTLAQLHYGASTGEGGVTPTAAAVGTSGDFAVWNPTASGIIVVPVSVQWAYRSGTVGNGLVRAWFAPNQGNTVPGGSELTPYAMWTASVRGKARAFSLCSGVLATISAGPVLFNLSSTIATAATV